MNRRKSSRTGVVAGITLILLLFLVLGCVCSVAAAAGRDPSSGHELADEVDLELDVNLDSTADDTTMSMDEGGAAAAGRRETSKSADPQQQQRAPSPSPPPSSPFGPVETLPKWLQGGRLELGCLVGLVLVAITAFNGKQRNQKVCESWAKATEEIFSQNFELCGFSDSVFKAFGWDYFEYYATGRSNCSYCLVKLQCRRRQCLWQDSIVRYLTCSEDLMDMEMSLTMPEKFSVVLGRRMQLKMLQTCHKDLASCISIKSSPHLSPALCVLSDDFEAVEKLITESEGTVLNSYASSIRHLIISDLLPSERFACHTKIFRCSFALPSEDRMAEILPLLQTVFRLADKISSLTLTEQARNRVKKSREELEKRQVQGDEDERRDAMEKKKAEKLKNMNPEERRKLEEKQQKKQEKALKPKVKMIKM